MQPNANNYLPKIYSLVVKGIFCGIDKKSVIRKYFIKVYVLYKVLKEFKIIVYAFLKIKLDDILRKCVN